VLSSRPGDAGIARARLSLPRAVTLDRARLETACLATELAQRSCPHHSAYGHVTAWSPLLEQPLQGPVSLTPTGNGPPALKLAFDGQLPLDVVGKIRLQGKRVQIVFAGLPDVPISKLVVSLHGARRGLLVNRRDLCVRRTYFSSRFASHDGKAESRRSVLDSACGARKKTSRSPFASPISSQRRNSAFRSR